MVTLRTRTLRHEFLQGMLHHQVLKCDQVTFGGLLPDRLLAAGCLDDDSAHFEKTILGASAVHCALDTSEQHKRGLEKLHAEIMQAHADGSWITEAETALLKTRAKDAMQALWAFHEAYGQAELWARSLWCWSPQMWPSSSAGKQPTRVPQRHA